MQFDKLRSAERGRLGGKVLTGTADNPNIKIGEIVALTATTFTHLEGAGWSGDFGGATLPAGQSVKGYFTRIQLAGGSAIIYNAE